MLVLAMLMPFFAGMGITVSAAEIIPVNETIGLSEYTEGRYLITDYDYEDFFENPDAHWSYAYMTAAEGDAYLATLESSTVGSVVAPASSVEITREFIPFGEHYNSDYDRLMLVKVLNPYYGDSSSTYVVQSYAYFTLGDEIDSIKVAVNEAVIPEMVPGQALATQDNPADFYNFMGNVISFVDGENQHLWLERSGVMNLVAKAPGGEWATVNPMNPIQAGYTYGVLVRANAYWEFFSTNAYYRAYFADRGAGVTLTCTNGDYNIVTADEELGDLSNTATEFAFVVELVTVPGQGGGEPSNDQVNNINVILGEDDLPQYTIGGTVSDEVIELAVSTTPETTGAFLAQGVIGVILTENNYLQALHPEFLDMLEDELGTTPSYDEILEIINGMAEEEEFDMGPIWAAIAFGFLNPDYRLKETDTLGMVIITGMNTESEYELAENVTITLNNEAVNGLIQGQGEPVYAFYHVLGEPLPGEGGDDDEPYVITLDDSDLENAGACVYFYAAEDDRFWDEREGMLDSNNKTLNLEDNTDKAEVWLWPVSEDYAFDPNNLPVVTVTTGNTTVTIDGVLSMSECIYVIEGFTGDSIIKITGAAVAPDTPPVGGGTPELGSITIDAYYSEIFGKIEDGKTLPDLDSLLEMGAISAEVQDKGYNLIRIYAVDAKWYRASSADNYATIVEVEYDEVADTENNLYLIEVIVVSDPYLVDPDTFGLTSDGIHSGRDIYVNTNTSGWDYAIYEHQFFSLQTLEERNYFTVKFIPFAQDPDIPDGPVESDDVVVRLGEEWITRSGNTVTINVPNGEKYMLGIMNHADNEGDDLGYYREYYNGFIGQQIITPDNWEYVYNDCTVGIYGGEIDGDYVYVGIEGLSTSNGTPIVLNITEDQSIFLFHVSNTPFLEDRTGYKMYGILGVHAEAYIYDANVPTTHEHSYTYIANNNGTHNGACECGEDAIVNEGCTYVDGRCEKCGYSKPTAPSVHKHSFVYTPNSNNTHDGVCVCKQVSIFNQACTFVNGKCEKCGYSEPVDISVSNGENTVDAEAEVSGNDAIIKPLDVEQIEQLVGGENNSGDIVIDLTDLDKNIDTAGIPKSTLEAIVEAAEDTGNNTEHLIIKLSTAELKLDDTAMRAIVEQANGDIIKFNFDDVGLGRLNEAQKESVKDMDVRKGYEAYITVNDQRIGDFKGGNVEIIVPYEVPEGENIASFSVWYIDDDGTLEKQKSTYNGKEKCFVVTHFSDYIIVYSASDNFDNINSDSNSISDIESGCGRIICTIWIIVIILICVAVYFILKKRIQDKIKAEKVKH